MNTDNRELSDLLVVADRAEAEAVRRFGDLRRLGDAVGEAVRRAEATSRLESALHYGSRIS